jgi:spore maturation protein SpmA
MARSFRILRRLGMVLIVSAVVIMIIARSARPAPAKLVIPLAVAAGASVVTGLIVRYSLPLRLRLRLLHSLSPRLARRFFGDIPSPPEGGDTTGRR